MSILGQVLLTLVVLLACQGDMASPWAHPLRTNMLKENIRLLDQLQKMELSCKEMNVTNIFTDDKDCSKSLMKAKSFQRGNNKEILCKAATIALQGHSCHKHLKGIYHNLLGLVWGTRAGHKEPCPVAAGSTTSLKNFLKDLHQVLQEEYKSQK